MSAVLTQRIGSASPQSLSIPTSVLGSFTTPAIVVGYPSGYGGQRQIILKTRLSSVAPSSTIGGAVASSKQTSGLDGLPLAKGFPTWGIAVAAGVGGTLALLVAVLLVRAGRKRKWVGRLNDRMNAYDRMAQTPPEAGHPTAGASMSTAQYKKSWIGISGAPMPAGRRSSRGKQVTRHPVGTRRTRTFSNEAKTNIPSTAAADNRFNFGSIGVSKVLPIPVPREARRASTSRRVDTFRQSMKQKSPSLHRSAFPMTPTSPRRTSR